LAAILHFFLKTRLHQRSFQFALVAVPHLSQPHQEGYALLLLQPGKLLCRNFCFKASNLTYGFCKASIIARFPPSSAVTSVVSATLFTTRTASLSSFVIWIFFLFTLFQKITIISDRSVAG
uniref:Secreted protein n=1 Tax=Haemonchus placei TaxID=6290 RepID=A0A0N4X3Z6_HAEPC